MSAGFREMDGGDVDGGIASRAGGATEGRSTIDGTGCDLMPPPAASRDWRSTAHSRRVGRPRASSVVLVAAGCRRVVPSGVTRAPPRSEVRCSPWDARYCMRVWGRARRRQLPNLNTTPTNITPYILSALRVIYCPGDVRTWRPRVADSRLVLTPLPGAAIVRLTARRTRDDLDPAFAREGRQTHAAARRWWRAATTPWPTRTSCAAARRRRPRTAHAHPWSIHAITIPSGGCGRRSRYFTTLPENQHLSNRRLRSPNITTTTFSRVPLSHGVGARTTRDRGAVVAPPPQRSSIAPSPRQRRFANARDRDVMRRSTIT